jgi:hypothetical protein
MLDIRLNMNSAVEDVLNFKTCCGLQAQDQNLEILVSNRGDAPVELPARFDLEVAGQTLHFAHLMPAQGIRVEPGAVQAFYCQMDEALWAKAERIVLFDRADGFYPVPIVHA